MDAPLESILTDDCTAKAAALQREIHRCVEGSTEADVLAAIRMVAVGLDLSPPEARALAIYVRLLKRLAKPVLLEAAARLIKSYRYPTFPKPADLFGDMAEIDHLVDRIDTLVRLYP